MGFTHYLSFYKIILCIKKREHMQTTITKPDAAVQSRPNRYFPQWMDLPSEKFDPQRALRGAVRMGDKGLVSFIVERYLPSEDLVKLVAQADLNKRLVAAVDNKDPAAVRTALEAGADANAAHWNYQGGTRRNFETGLYVTPGQWLSVLRCALFDAFDGYHRTEEDRAKGREIVELLVAKGARGATWEESEALGNYRGWY